MYITSGRVHSRSAHAKGPFCCDQERSVFFLAKWGNVVRKVHAHQKSNGTKNAAEEDILGGKNFFDFVKIQNEKQRYNQKTEHSEDPLCADPLSTPKKLPAIIAETGAKLPWNCKSCCSNRAIIGADFLGTKHSSVKKKGFFSEKGGGI